jgi:hypothetical protein
MVAEKLSQVWEQHTVCEFVTRDAEATLATMVDDAYVNHVPVLTGGYGKDALRTFYGRDFIPKMPPDTRLTPVSRTVGDNQLVDEMIFLSPIRKRCLGCCRESHRQTDASRSRWWRLCDFAATRSHMSTSIGTKLRC